MEGSAPTPVEVAPKPMPAKVGAWSWPRAWEFALAFLLGICSVIVVQSAWKLLSPPEAIAASTISLDLNAADAGTLRQLPGVGPHLAARIVDHRDKHGPFQRIDDLRAVHGIGPATVERLRHMVMVSYNGAESGGDSRPMQPLRSGPKTTPGEPIDLNTATREQLMTLPGIGPTLAERILADREENGAFATVNDLTRIRGIKGKTLEKLLPFLVVRKGERGT